MNEQHETIRRLREENYRLRNTEIPKHLNMNEKEDLYNRKADIIFNLNEKPKNMETIRKRIQCKKLKEFGTNVYEEENTRIDTLKGGNKKNEK